MTWSAIKPVAPIRSILYRKKRMGKTVYIVCLCLLPIYMAVSGQPSHDEAVVQGLRFQEQADSMQRLVEAQVLALATTPESQKNDVKIAIRDADRMAASLQKKADDLFAQAVTLEDAAVAAKDTVAVEEPVTVSEEDFDNAEPQPTTPPVFAILPQSPYSATDPIPIDEPLPDGVAYKIQLGAFSKPLSANAFKGITPISGERLAGGITKYYAGLFLEFTDADVALRKVREYGFKDAYIVAFYNRKTINIERAKQLEGH